MNKKFHIHAFRGMLVCLLVLALSACTAQSEQMAPVAESTATMEPAIVPSPTIALTADDSVNSAVDVSLATKPIISSQTINDVTATIDQAYADESHVVIKYTISGLDWPDYVQMDDTLMASLSSTAIHDISAGGVGWSTGSVMDGAMTGYVDQELTVNAVDVAQTPIVDLQVDIPVDGTGALLYAPPSPGQSPQPLPVELPNVGTFHFELEIPISAGIQLMDINQTVEANGISMTLKSLVLNRSHVDALLCYETPSAQDWWPDLRFGLGGEPNPDTPKADGSSLFLVEGFSPSAPERCVGLGSNVSYEGSPTKVVLTIPKLLTGIPDSWFLTEESMKNANQKLADKGIVVAYNNDPHNPFVVVQRPDGATDGDIYPLIWDALADWYEGPWEFTVEVNP